MALIRSCSSSGSCWKYHHGHRVELARLVIIRRSRNRSSGRSAHDLLLSSRGIRSRSSRKLLSLSGRRDGSNLREPHSRTSRHRAYNHFALRTCWFARPAIGATGAFGSWEVVPRSWSVRRFSSRRRSSSRRS